MAADEPIAHLREQGVVLLRNFFSQGSLIRLKQAAVACFEAIGGEELIPERYRYSRASHSVVLTSLTDFGCGPEQLAEPLSADGLDQLFYECCGSAWKCHLEQSWIRKKLAPRDAPSRGQHLQNWHQDGALGVRFTMEPGPMPPMTDLITCWIPLHNCGADSPGLEFVSRPNPGLLHFTELDDSVLRRRFPAEDFWTPVLELGDGLVFLNSVLHRTSVRPEMRRDRLSVDYRIFPA